MKNPLGTIRNRLRRAKSRTIFNVAHFSMQFNDTFEQKQHDAEIIFTRNYDWITGTEAGEQPLKGILKANAKLNGYTFFEFKSLWIAVRKDLIVSGSYETGSETVVDNDLTVGIGNDSSIARVTFRHALVGKITVLCSHYPTKGRPTGDREHSVNVKWNRVLARAIQRTVLKYGRGRAIVFYGGDQNIVDRISDTFFGGDLKSIWDILKKWMNTGHGNIDVIAINTNDPRVEAVYIRALSDKLLKMFSDHYVVEAGVSVRNLVDPV